MCKNICHWRRENCRNTKIKFVHYTKPISTTSHCVRPCFCSRRNAVFIKEVTPEASKSKPPLPAEATHQVPKPPPRSRPKSWTSTLFNAMRNNHRSVTFQCVDEENHVNVSSEVIVATDPTMPLAAASSSEGQKFYSLPRQPPNARSRTPSPFRSMIKGLVKGKRSYTRRTSHASFIPYNESLTLFYVV